MIFIYFADSFRWMKHDHIMPAAKSRSVDYHSFVLQNTLLWFHFRKWCNKIFQILESSNDVQDI